MVGNYITDVKTFQKFMWPLILEETKQNQNQFMNIAFSSNLLPIDYVKNGTQYLSLSYKICFKLSTLCAVSANC